MRRLREGPTPEITPTNDPYNEDYEDTHEYDYGYDSDDFRSKTWSEPAHRRVESEFVRDGCA